MPGKPSGDQHRVSCRESELEAIQAGSIDHRRGSRKNCIDGVVAIARGAALSGGKTTRLIRWDFLVQELDILGKATPLAISGAAPDGGLAQIGDQRGISRNVSRPNIVN